MVNRPFEVLGVQQIALGGRDRRALRALWADCFGLPSVGTYRSTAENVDEEMLSVGLGLGRVEIDLMEPVDENGRPVIHSPSLHHIGLWVDALSSAVTWLVMHGVRFARGGIRPGAAGHDVCFVHPRPSPFFPLSGNGVLIELVQAPPDVIADYRRLARQP